ncbi:MAG: TonB-dependent receptor [Candidatus Omnitrophica bacterium]|nr:TonB-dependent receptor [Candidatus Omnitrophota bacterium]
MLNEAVFKRETLGLYLRDEFNIMKELILTAGYRTERAKIRGHETDSATGAALIPETQKVHHGDAYELGLTCLIQEKSKIFARYATVYRLPFLDEQASYFGYLGWDTFLLHLEKERGKSYEAGAQFVVCDNLKVGAPLCRINREEDIAFNLATWQNENLDKTRHDGIELSMAWQWQKYLRFLANYTCQDATFRDGPNDGKKIPWSRETWQTSLSKSTCPATSCSARRCSTSTRPTSEAISATAWSPSATTRCTTSSCSTGLRQRKGSMFSASSAWRT